MKNSTRFQRNMDVWANFYPKEAVMLPYVEADEYVIENDLLVGPKGVYQLDDPKEWFSKIPFQDERVLVVYGIGLGEMYPVIKKWLKKDETRRVFFFEEDPNVLVRFFETKQASKMLDDPQVEIHLLESLSDTDPALEKFYWSCVLTKAIVAAHPAYKAWYPERAEEFEHYVLFTLSNKNSLVEEYILLGLSFFRSFYFNILDLPDAYSGNQLFGKFEDVPAIICGAGPSLEKQIETLKGIKDKAFLVAGGSSLNALSFGGLLPHFSCGLDPNAEQAVRLRTNNAKGVPFFYRNRMHRDAFRLISGPRVFITGSGGYDVSEYFEEKLKMTDEFIDEGHNVINFLCEITSRLGCNPIIFVGMDLAFTGMQTYAKGVVDNYEFTEKSLPPKAVLKKDYEGKPVWTEWKWIGEAKWISDFAKEHPKLTFLNATEGGLGFEGIKNIPLQEVIRKHLKKDLNLAPRLTQAIEEVKIKGVTREDMRQWMKELQESLKRVLESLITMEKDAEERIQNNPSAEAPGHIALLEMDLLEEDGYRYVLDMFNLVYATIQSNSLRRLRMARDKTKSIEEVDREKLVMQNERIQHLKNVANLNIQIIQLALDEDEKERSKV